ncbi:hypothetical protein D3C79_809530 [compost metagenome]
MKSPLPCCDWAVVNNASTGPSSCSSADSPPDAALLRGMPVGALAAAGALFIDAMSNGSSAIGLGLVVIGADVPGPVVIGVVLIGATPLPAGNVWMPVAPAPCGIITVTPESSGRVCACEVPLLMPAAERLAVTRSLLDTRVLESTTGMLPR